MEQTLFDSRLKRLELRSKYLTWLYLLLDLEEGLIEESDGSPDPDASRDRRRYYRLTSSGRKLASAEAERLADLLRVARAKKIFKGELSEKMLALLLLLHPAAFRERYLHEALFLCRDRRPS